MMGRIKNVDVVKGNLIEVERCGLVLSMTRKVVVVVLRGDEYKFARGRGLCG